MNGDNLLLMWLCVHILSVWMHLCMHVVGDQKDETQNITNYSWPVSSIWFKASMKMTSFVAPALLASLEASWNMVGVKRIMSSGSRGMLSCWSAGMHSR